MNHFKLNPFGIAFLLLPASVHAQQKTAVTEKPNIIMIMVDDLGFSDIGAYGATDIHTPNLDQLARQGIRFRQFYNNSISAPTRASLITGQYSHKASIGYFNVNLGTEDTQGFLNRESLTFAEVLKAVGYSTLMSGKWHVGDDKNQWPNQRGFEHFFGFIGGASNYYDIGTTGEWNGVNLIKDNQPYKLPKGKYLTEAITDNAIDFLEEQQKEQKPFFLYLAFNAPHWPLQALPQDIAKYKSKYTIGWDSLRQIRYRNTKELGVVSSNQALAQRDTTIRLWNKLTYDEKEFWQRRQEVYAAMIDRMDHEVGRIMNELKKLKKDKNTLVLFISDNGAQGGPDNRVYSFRNTGPVGSPGSYDIQNSNWSQTGNAPFRNYKNSPYEGGISAPFIAWFPGKIKGGQIVDGIGHIIDIAPTFYDIASATYPSVYNGIKTNALAGKSLLPILTGKASQIIREEPLCWERAGNIAVRSGKWKYVSIFPENKDELYNIEDDRAENNNVAKQYPEIVRQLKEQYQHWASSNKVTDFHLLHHARQ